MESRVEYQLLNLDKLQLQKQNLQLKKKIAYKNIVTNRLKSELLNEKNKKLKIKVFDKKNSIKYFKWLIPLILGLLLGYISSLILTVSLIGITIWGTFYIKLTIKKLLREINQKEKNIKKALIEQKKYQNNINQEMINLHYYSKQEIKIKQELRDSLLQLREAKENLKSKDEDFEEIKTNDKLITDVKVKTIMKSKTNIV